MLIIVVGWLFIYLLFIINNITINIVTTTTIIIATVTTMIIIIIIPVTLTNVSESQKTCCRAEGGEGESPSISNHKISWKSVGGGAIRGFVRLGGV